MAQNWQKYDQGQVSAIARFFSATVVREMACKGRSPLFARLVAEASLQDLVLGHEPVSKALDTAFDYLKKKNNRHEYIYKAAITHKVLLGTHSLSSAALLSEFRTGSSKADIVVLNGTSTVYEIKSERDKLDRLRLQVEDYRQVFANVNVITGANHAKAVIEIVPNDVGVLLLSDRYQISTYREANESVERLKVGAIFDSIQLSEAKAILKINGIGIPELPNTRMYEAVQDKFSMLNSKQAHTGMVEVLKKARNHKPLEVLTKNIPASLITAILTTRIKKSDFTKLMEAVRTPYATALNWR